MNRRSRYRTFLLFAITVIMLACVPTLAPASAPVPTFDANAPLTAIVQTAAVAGTQTAINAPPTATPTASPTRTPTITPTATPTFMFIFITKTQPPTQAPVGNSGLAYDCQVLAVEPAESTLVAVSAPFTAKWTVANIGKATWSTDSTDYRYFDGKRMYLQSIYDLELSVVPGVTVELRADMQAPSEPGTYTTSWRITIGDNWFCPMDLTITVT